MNIKSIFLFVAISLVLAGFASCSKFENSLFVEAIERDIQTEEDALANFSIAISKAACQHLEVRELIRNEALKKFDNDYDVLYQNVKNQEISGLGTFRDVLISYMSSEDVMTTIENLLPSLTIYVSDATWFDPSGFCADNWDPRDCRLAVTYKNANGVCKELFSNGYDLGGIEDGTIPGGPVLIVKKNERIETSTPTKSGEVTYTFIDDAFNGGLSAETKGGRYSGNYTTSWIEGQDPEDNSDVISASALNLLNPDIIIAYNLFKNHSYALQNDYIYYGMTPLSSKGALRTDVRSKIVRFKISPRAFNSLFDDPNGSDMNYVDTLDTDDNGQGYEAEPSVSTIYSRLWADGALEIRINTTVYGNNGNNTSLEEYSYNVSARDLFTVKDSSILKEQWEATAFKWYITWRYSISARNETTLEEKWYYPENSPNLPTWDLLDNSAFYIIASEVDSGTETTISISNTTKKGKQTSSKISNEQTAEVGGLLGTIKNELGWSSSDEVTNTTTVTFSWKNGDDLMGKHLISYADKYIREQTSSGSYVVYSYGADKFIFTILPYRY